MWTRSNKPCTIRKSRRGSVLVIVVAVLTMIALIGTAYIATARLDRYSAQNYVATAEQETVRDRYIEQVDHLVRDAIARDFDNPVTGPRSVPWLADRLPEWLNNEPIWRFISGKLYTPPGNYDANHEWNRKYHTPLLPNERLAAPYDGWNGGFRDNYSQFLSNGNSGRGSNRFIAVPTSITLEYPNDYPAESYRNKTRTFPAFVFYNPGIPGTSLGHYVLNSQGKKAIYLAADADGDGIADSVLFRVSNGPVQGVTYYAAVRIIDNSSAININTARTRGDAEYNNGNPGTPLLPAGTDHLRTFFPSSIGLRELFMVGGNVNKPHAGWHLWAIDEHRFGYDPGVTHNNAGSTPESRVPKSLVPRLDSGVARNDFQFLTNGEALSTQLARRLENPGMNQQNVSYRAFDADDAAALAYRYCMLRLDPYSSDIYTSLTQLEKRVYDSVPNPNQVDGLVRSAPNYTEDPSNSFKSFPANAVEMWYRWLSYDGLFYSTDYPFNAGFDESKDLGKTSPFQAPTNQYRFRSVRPILTAHNPVTNLVRQKVNSFKWQNHQLRPGQVWSNVLYPGMLNTDPNRLHDRRNYLAGVRYFKGDVVFDPSLGTGRRFMYIGPDNSPAPSPKSDLTSRPWRPQYWDPQPYSRGMAKTSINTAGFPELWRAFFLAMGQHPTKAENTPFDSADSLSKANPYHGMKFSGSAPSHSGGEKDENKLRMFRSSLRDWRNSRIVLTPYQTMVLRSALAAVNTISLRDKMHALDRDKVPARSFVLYDESKNSALKPPLYEVTVYGMKPQPFITEVYANNDTNQHGGYQNPNGYVAIKLYNPYSVAIQLKGWKIARFARQGPSYGGAGNTLTVMHTFGATDEVPAGGMLLLDSYPTTGGGPNPPYRPLSSKLNLTGSNAFATDSTKQYRSIPGIASVLDNEFILLRPIDPGVTAGLLTHEVNMVPVDQFDFTGLKLSNTQGRTWHYVRDTSDGRYVYPGRYDGSLSDLRHQGIDNVSYTAGSSSDDWTDDDSVKTAPFPAGKNRTPPTPIRLDQISTTNASYANGCTIPWPEELGTPAPTTRYPFGKFARNADILQVPFIGAYCIRRYGASPTGTDIVEMNAVTMDSAFAEDTNPDNNEVVITSGNTTEIEKQIRRSIAEQVGRFCPLAPINDMTTKENCANDHYNWAGRLFDYMDVQIPADDYLPNANPATYNRTSYVSNTIPPNSDPDEVLSRDQANGQANLGWDDAIPTHGKINVNTAPSKVLAMLPLVSDADGYIWAWNPNSTAAPALPGTENVARAIRYYRESPDGCVVNPGNNTFRDAFETILDLNKVPMVRQAAAKAATAAMPHKQGNYMNALLATNDPIRHGFDERFLITNRVSNLITTRSDTFTAYIVVQGWKQAGTDLPCLDWEQRRAFIIDRSRGPRNLRIIPVPTD